MSNLVKIIDELDALSTHEKGQLVSLLEEAWGVKALSSQPIQNLTINQPPVEVQDSFAVVLTGFTSKIDAIKVVRQVLGLDLKSAKDFVEGAPKTVKEDMSRSEAEALVNQIVASGGTAQIK